jgi:L-2-hydroxyglutarate oxidase
LTSQTPYEVAVVGAGIVGLATARELLLGRPGMRLLVLEKESEPGTHQSSRNSGVVHSGVYYLPGSLKAELCLEGRRWLLAYCAERGIPFAICGKVIVATEEREFPHLEAIRRRGAANGVPGLEMIGPERLRDLEPRVRGARALVVPGTGIVDFRQVVAALAGDVRSLGGEVRTGFAVTGTASRDGEVVLSGPAGEVSARVLVGCAGLWADRLAVACGAPDDLRIIPFRGDYYELRPERRSWVRGLIYPVPDPALPFLGVHFTRRIDGRVMLGPNAVLAVAREGYRRSDVDLAELHRILTYRGFRALTRRYWMSGVAEWYRAVSRRAYLAALRRYIPELAEDDLLPGGAGIRAQAVAPDGRLVDDFIIWSSGRTVHLRNAPSPAATSSLALARRIAARVLPLCG